MSGSQLALEKRLLSLCRPFSNDESAPQAKLCRRIERFLKELFVSVSHPEVHSDNNAAERSLRHLVVSRKISGGARFSTGNRQKDDSRICVRHMESQWPRSSPPTPQPARISLTLDSYNCGPTELRPGCAVVAPFLPHQRGACHALVEVSLARRS